MLHRYQSYTRPLSALLAGALMLLIYHESGQPLTVNLNSFPLEDKLVHAVAYGVLASLFLFTQRLHATGFTIRQQFIATGLAILYGISDEWHQSFIPERTADIGDIIADAIGASLAVIILGRFARKTD